MNRITPLRRKIDNIDAKIIALLSLRTEMSKAIAKEKKRLRTTVFIPKREEEVIKNVRKTAKKNGLDQSFVESLFKKIIKHSRAEQRGAFK